MAMGLSVGTGFSRSQVTISADRFVTIDADLDRDWIHRDSYHALRVPRFRLDGREIDEPLSIVTRFDPPPIGLQQLVIAEGLLRRTNAMS